MTAYRLACTVPFRFFSLLLYSSFEITLWIPVWFITGQSELVREGEEQCFVLVVCLHLTFVKPCEIEKMCRVHFTARGDIDKH